MHTLWRPTRVLSAVASRYRLATLLAFLALVGVLDAAGIAAPDGALSLLAAWTLMAAAGVGAHSLIRGSHRAMGLHAALTAADVTLLTLVQLLYGGGWWLGAGFHFLLLVYAYASLPRPLARVLAAWVLAAFAALLWLQDASFVRELSYLGVDPLGDRGRLAAGIAVLGLAALLCGSIGLHHLVETLAAQRRAYRLLLESAEDMIFTFDREGRFVALNDSAVRQSGYARDEVLGQSFVPFIEPEDRECTLVHFSAALQGVARQYEVRYRRRDGSLRWISCTNTPIREVAHVTGVLAIARDVTARHEAESERERSLAILQATFESTTDGILVVDDTRRIVSHNARFAILWNLPDRSLVSQPDVAPLEAVLAQLADPAGFVRRVEEIYADPSAESIDVLHLRDGRVLERYSRAQRLSGRPAGRVWSFRDVTAQVRVETSLRDSEQRYRMVLEQSTDGVVVFDDASAIVSVNPALAQMLGWKPDELVGRSIGTTVRPGELEAVPVRYDLLRAGATTRRVRRFLRRDGSDLTAEVVSKMLPTGHFLALVRDITERELLETQLRQAQKMEAVGQLAGGVAHDFNNLLTVISANAELALEALPEDAVARDDVEEIRRACVRAASLTRQLLAFSRRQPMQASVVDPVQLLGELGRLLERLITPSIELRLDVPPTLWRVQADAGQIEQTIVNLVVNARDAMPGGGTLSICARDEALDAPLPHAHGAVPAGEYVRLDVQDSGTGIAPDVLGRIFEPFFTTKEPGKGTGLGLSTVYGIVKQHGGHILVHTRLGEGTRFRVYFPRTTEEPALEESAAEASVLDEQPDATILLVDDEHAVLHAVRRTLERRGYTVIWARSPEEALAAEAAHQGPIDALVTDVVMPRMSGRTLAESICARRAGIGVLYLTGHTTDGALRRHVLGPNRQLLYKPFTTESLLSAVSSVSRGAARSTAA